MSTLYHDPEITPETDLTNCDLEPIHRPDAIFSCGLMLVAEPQSWRILQASANVEAIAGRGLTEVLGAPLAELLGEDLMADVWRAAASLPSVPVLVRAGDFFGTGMMNLLCHFADHHVLLEFECVQPSPSGATTATLDRFTSHLSQGEEVATICHSAAELIREISGFDRVMVYRFSPEGNGAVVAESRAPSVADSFLGLNYPASDIPANARRLYLRNWIRAIPTVEYGRVPMVPRLNPNTGRPVDMSMAVLRAVSPVHVEYLQNMGVQASMSISIIVEGQLWGLVACHHYAPWHLPFPHRVMYKLIGEFLSVRLSAAMERENYSCLLRINQVQHQILERVARTGDIVGSLAGGEPGMRELFSSDGAAVLHGGACHRLGQTPDEESIRRLVNWIAVHRPAEAVFHTDHLQGLRPELTGFDGGACGVLAVRISKSLPNYLLWFRGEVTRTVSWGGKPEKIAEETAQGVRLSPRKSFEKWQQTVQGHSLPWTEPELHGAREIRSVFVEVALQAMESVYELRFRLEKHSEELSELSLKRDESVAFMESMLENAPVGFGFFDREGRCVRVNRCLADLAGLTPEAFSGRSVAELFPGAGEQVARSIARVFETGQPASNLEATGVRTHQGHDRTWITGYYPVLMAGHTVFVGFVVSDITDRKRSEMALRSANQALESFAFIASHDLRTPLRSAANYLYLIRRTLPPLTKEAEDYLLGAFDALRRMNQLITDILHLSRIQRVSTEAAPTDLSELLEEVLRALTSDIQESGAEIQVLNPLPTITTNSGLLASLLQNLIANGIRFRHQGVAPRVELGWEAEGSGCRFFVRDNGIGIPERYFGRIFEPFKRLHPQSRYEGSGIGLSICRQIVERLGGRIWVESAHGAGSTFFFWLPQELPATATQETEGTEAAE